MGMLHLSKFIIALAMACQALAAEEVNVQTLSEGACWYEQGEYLKMASFNDRESIVISRDEIEFQVDSLLNRKKNKAITSDLTFHCGGYGSSLVVKSELENKPICLWLKFTKGKLDIRSLGGLENTKSDLCDGYKWGELIIGIKSPEQKALLESESFRGMIKSVSVISGSTIKVTLTEAFHGKEQDAMNELKNQMSLRYVELNFFQHPVGEAATLK